MKFAITASFLLASLVPAAFGQQNPIVYDSIHNASSLEGTWASGAGNVLTGPGFATPANLSFHYPKTSGVAYAFTNDGYVEISRYRFVSNASAPTCITGVISWTHGTYELMDNGSMVVTPFGDGYQQVQDPCAAISNFIETYNYTELYSQWRIYYDDVVGVYKLHLFGFDGTPVAPLFRVSESPNMLPTQKLRNASGMITGKTKRDFSAAAPQNMGSRVGLAASLVGAAIAAFVV
jgi:hypothetical protein